MLYCMQHMVITVQLLHSHSRGIQMIGMLNYDVWRWIAGYTVDDMRLDKSYPNFPDVSFIVVATTIIS